MDITTSSSLPATFHIPRTDSIPIPQRSYSYEDKSASYILPSKNSLDMHFDVSDFSEEDSADSDTDNPRDTFEDLGVALKRYGKSSTPKQKKRHWLLPFYMYL